MHTPLFFAPPQHEKVAGFKLPSNPKLWNSEIIRYLKSQHPYLPLEESEIDIRRMDPARGAAVGSIVIDNEIAVPIIIARPRPGADPELAPMDVFFHKGRYQYLDPEAIKQLSHKPQIGEPEKGRSRAYGGNPYIGDMTGDATPLEYSGQASPFAGPYDGTKVSSLLPEWMLKEAVSEQARERAAQGGVLFGLTGAMTGAMRGARSGGNARARLVRALSGGAKGAAEGAVVGTTAGAATPGVRKALGIERKEKRRESRKIKDVVRRELEKESAFSVGIDAVADDGLLARLTKVAYLDPNDISNFRHLLATNPHVLQGSANNLKLVEIVARRGPETPGTRGNAVKHPNIMQVYPKPDGRVCIKFSNGPETAATRDELKAALGDRYTEVMSRLRAGGVYMEHDGVQRASWDVIRAPGSAKPVSGDGMYSVRTRDGDSVTGMVCTQIMDLDGKTLPLKLFVSPEGKYAVAGELFGVKLSSKHRLPAQRPAPGASGVFINYVHGTPIATLPMRLIGVRSLKPVDGDARVLYLVQNPVTGERFALSPVQRAQGFERMRVVDPGVQSLAEGAPVYYMPGDSEWVPLRSPVTVAESSEQLSKLASEDVTSVVYAAGLWHVDAAVSTRSFTANESVVKTAQFQDMNGPETRELLVSMGMDVDGACQVMDQARERPGHDRGVKVAGLHAPQRQGFEVIEPVQEVYDRALVNHVASMRPGTDLLKAAAESGHVETLDAMLSLEFITPQNLRYFIDNIADFEEAATRLAALLIAVRLGMPHVPEQPVRDALEGLSKTINKLKVMKSANDNKSSEGT